MAAYRTGRFEQTDDTGPWGGEAVFLANPGNAVSRHVQELDLSPPGRASCTDRSQWRRLWLTGPICFGRDSAGPGVQDVEARLAPSINEGQALARWPIISGRIRSPRDGRGVHTSISAEKKSRTNIEKEAHVEDCQ
jgi:hypothetical protein